MVDIALGWKVLKMPFLLFAFLSTLKKFDTIRGYLKDKRKSSHDWMFPKGKSHYSEVYKQKCVGFIFILFYLYEGLLFSKKLHTDHKRLL